VAPPSDVVGLAVDEEELAVVVDAAKIAGVEPAVVAGAGFGVTEVPSNMAWGCLGRITISPVSPLGSGRAASSTMRNSRPGCGRPDEPGLAGRRASPIVAGITSVWPYIEPDEPGGRTRSVKAVR